MVNHGPYVSLSSKISAKFYENICLCEVGDHLSTVDSSELDDMLAIWNISDGPHLPRPIQYDN